MQDPREQLVELLERVQRLLKAETPLEASWPEILDLTDLEESVDAVLNDPDHPLLVEEWDGWQRGEVFDVDRYEAEELPLIYRAREEAAHEEAMDNRMRSERIDRRFGLGGGGPQ